MNRQEAFEKACLGMERQGYRRSMRPDTERSRAHPICMYLNSAGDRCAIGQLLTEQEARDVEGCGSIRDIHRAPGLPNSLSDFQEDIDFLQELQAVHDSGQTPEQMRDNIEAFALKYRLRVP